MEQTQLVMDRQTDRQTLHILSYFSGTAVFLSLIKPTITLTHITSIATV